MTVHYSGVANRHTYLCSRQLVDYGGDVCQYVAGPVLDHYVVQQVLAALEPAALELSLAAAQQLERERADLDRLWQQRRERAAYTAERAGRQYHLAEPENRLVVRQLEREWEERLAAQEQLEEGYHRFLHQHPQLLTPAEQEAIRQLAVDIPVLWNAPTTTNAERKEIVRQVLSRVVVLTQGKTEQVQVRLEWIGGSATEERLTRPVARWEQLSYYPELCERVRSLAAEDLDTLAIAERLNSEGYRPPKRCEQFGPAGVRDLLRHLGLRKPHSKTRQCAARETDEWLLQELAAHLTMPPVTLYRWVQRGWVQAHQEAVAPRRWIVWADTAEVKRLQQLHQRPAGTETRRLWQQEADAVTEPQADENT